MKVFLSWSGEISHQVAKVFRGWFPSVIQSLEPYVSSEDIDKGTRWSTDIAQELEDSSFGILCVTKDNVTAPWLTFEAGALSKTMDSAYVSPFLFDIKRSEIDGPILQFQSTIFAKEDVFKLVTTLNKASGESKLSDDMLKKAFEVWWPTLETELQAIQGNGEVDEGSETSNGLLANSEILEEILNLTRLNQKLLRNPDSLKQIAQINDNIHTLLEGFDRERMRQRKDMRRIHPRMLEDLLHLPMESKNKFFAFQIILSRLRDDYPWLRDEGLELVKTLRSKISKDKKEMAVHDYIELVKLSSEHPVIRDISRVNKEQYMMLHELPYILKHHLMRELES